MSASRPLGKDLMRRPPRSLRPVPAALAGIVWLLLLWFASGLWAQHPGQPSLDAAVRAYIAGDLDGARAFADRAADLGLNSPDLDALYLLAEPLPREVLRRAAELEDSGLRAIDSAEILRAQSAALARLMDWDGLLELGGDLPGNASADPLVLARVLRAYAATGTSAYLDAEERLLPAQEDDPRVRAVMVSQLERARFTDLQWIRRLPHDAPGLDALLHAYVAVEDRSRVVDELARRYYRIGGTLPDPAARAALLHPAGEFPADLRDRFVESGGLRRLDLLGPVLTRHAQAEPELALLAGATLNWTADANADGFTDASARIQDGELTWEADADQDGVAEQVVRIVDGLPVDYTATTSDLSLFFVYRDYPEVARVHARTEAGPEVTFHLADEVLTLPVADPLRPARQFGGVALPSLELLPPPVFRFADLRMLATEIVATLFTDSAAVGSREPNEVRFSLQRDRVQTVQWSIGSERLAWNPQTGLLQSRIVGRDEVVEWQANNPGILAAGFRIRLINADGQVILSGESADGRLTGAAIPPLFMSWTVERELRFPAIPRLEEFSWSD